MLNVACAQAVFVRVDVEVRWIARAKTGMIIECARRVGSVHGNVCLNALVPFPCRGDALCIVGTLLDAVVSDDSNGCKNGNHDYHDQ